MGLRGTLVLSTCPSQHTSDIATVNVICLANHPPARGEHCYGLGVTAPLIALKKVLISIESHFAARNRSECDLRINKRVPVQNSKTLTLSMFATNQSVLEKEAEHDE